jgi:hypothetical protein
MSAGRFCLYVEKRRTRLRYPSSQRYDATRGYGGQASNSEGLRVQAPNDQQRIVCCSRGSVSRHLRFWIAHGAVATETFASFDG